MSLVFRAGLAAVLVQWGAVVVGFLVIDAPRIAVQWDFPTGHATNEMPKWLGLLLFPVVSSLALWSSSRAIDAPGLVRVVRIGAVTIFTLAQLAIVVLNA